VAPCSNCPFLREGGVRLRPERAADIAGQFLDDYGKTFACHKTTGASGGKRVLKKNQSHCAGALIFCHKNGHRTQLHQVLQRMGFYDPTLLRGHDRVFDTIEEMLEANHE
jgi:hypothetical protein